MTVKKFTLTEDKMYSKEELLLIGTRMLHINTLPTLRDSIIDNFEDLAHILLSDLPAPVTPAVIESRTPWDDELLQTLEDMRDKSLDDQMTLLAQQLCLSPERLVKINRLMESLDQCLKEKFSQCKLHLYGSTVSGFATENSDIDIFVDIGHEILEKEAEIINETKHVATILKHKERFGMIQTITRARKPIIKLKDKRTRIDCDINVGCRMGVKNSQFLHFYFNLDPKYSALGRILKYFCMKRGIVGSGPGDHLNSYSIILMTMFYLQVKQLFPTIENLQQGVQEDILNDWNFAYDINYSLKKRSGADVTTLMKGFFNFYKNYLFETHVICPLIGRPIKKYNLKYGYNLPKCLSLSPKFGKKQEKLDCNKILVIQDPFELTRNVSSIVSERLVRFMVAVFEDAHQKLSSGHDLVDIIKDYQESCLL